MSRQNVVVKSVAVLAAVFTLSACAAIDSTTDQHAGSAATIGHSAAETPLETENTFTPDSVSEVEETEDNYEPLPEIAEPLPPPTIGPAPGRLISLRTDGAALLDIDGNESNVVSGPVYEIASDMNGGFVFQRVAEDSIVWWLPKGSTKARQLLVAAPESQYLTLEGVADFGSGPSIIYQRLVTGTPEVATNTLRAYNFVSGNVVELATTGGWEASTEFSAFTPASTGLVAGVWSDGVDAGLSVLDLGRQSEIYNSSADNHSCAESGGICGAFLVSTIHNGKMLGVGFLTTPDDTDEAVTQQSDSFGLSELDYFTGEIRTVATLFRPDQAWYPENIFVADNSAVVSRSSDPDHNTPLEPLIVDLATGESHVLDEATWVRPDLN